MANEARVSTIRIDAQVSSAEAQMRRLQQTGRGVTDRLTESFESLGLRSSVAIEQERARIEAAYQRIRSAGVATNEEIARAERARATQVARLDAEEFGRRETLLQKFKSNWLAASAAIGAAWFAAMKGWDLAKQSAQDLQQRQSFANLAASRGVNADALITDLKRVSAETISTQQLVEKAGTAMLLGIEAKYLPKLTEIARASSRITGQTTMEAFGDLSLAVARQSKMILDNLGIMLDVEKANKDYAAAMNITGRELTDVERKQAFLNAVMVEGQKIIDDVGVSGLTAMEKMQRLEAAADNLQKVVGRGALAAMALLDGSLKGLAAAALLAASGIYRLISAGASLARQKSVAEEYRQASEAALSASLDLAEKGRDSLSSAMDAITGKVEGATEAQIRYQQKLDAARAAEQAAAEETRRREAATQAAADAAKRLADEWQRTSRELTFENALRGADEFDAKIVRLALRAQELREKFGNKPIIDEWLRGEVQQVTVSRGAGGDSDANRRAEEAARRAEQLRESVRQLMLDLQGEEARLFDAAVRRAAMVVEAADQQVISEQRKTELLLQVEADYQSRLDEMRRAAAEREVQQEIEKATRLGELWWSQAQTYIGFAQQMATMGAQYALADEEMRGQIARRMLATTIRFLTQSLAAYLFNKAKEKVFAASASAAQIAAMGTVAAADMSIGATRAAAWAAYYAAHAANPVGAAIYGASAAAMTAAAAGFGVAGAASAATAAAGVSANLSAAAGYAAAGIAVTAIGEALAGKVEGTLSGSGQGVYGAGSPTSPVITAPAGGLSTARVVSNEVNITIVGHVVDHDKFAREMVPAISKAINDGVRD